MHVLARRMRRTSLHFSVWPASQVAAPLLVSTPVYPAATEVELTQRLIMWPTYFGCTGTLTLCVIVGNWETSALITAGEPKLGPLDKCTPSPCLIRRLCFAAAEKKNKTLMGFDRVKASSCLFLFLAENQWFLCFTFSHSPYHSDSFYFFIYINRYWCGWSAFLLCRALLNQHLCKYHRFHF